MSISLHTAVSIAHAMDKQRKQEEWKQRMYANIQRWGESAQYLDKAADKINTNINKNIDALTKVNHFLSRINSSKSKEWYERALLNVHKYENLQTKVSEYEEKVKSAEDRISRLKTWISDGKASLKEIEDKIENIDTKINDVEEKLN